MSGTFLRISGEYECVSCGKKHRIEESLEGDRGCYDSGIIVDCDCGVEFTMNVNFEGEDDSYDDDENDDEENEEMESVW